MATVDETSRLPGLDGLRGVAVALVVVAHLEILPWRISGMHGVTIFFVLSGFLITSVLLRNEEIDIGAFLKRRARRLLPALFVVLTVGLIAGWFGWRMAVPSVTYTSSFLAASGASIEPIRHTWSLAVEEHFYLIWPFLIVVFRRRLGWLVALALAAVAWRTFLMIGSSWQRVYYSSDANAFAVLLGCALAVARDQGRVKPSRPFFGLLSVLGIAVLSMIPSQGTIWLRLGLAVPVGLLAAVSVNAAGGTGLAARPWVWLGTISYGLYLWHWILDYAYPGVPGPLVGGAALVVAWLSWTLIERPILSSGRQLAAIKVAGGGTVVGQ